MINARFLPQSEEHLWDNFILSYSLSTIHQTSSWAHFQASLPERDKYWIIVLEENEKIIGGSLVIRHRLPKGYSWLYCPRGPLLDYSNEQMKIFLDTLKPLAKKERAVFLRIDPPITASREAQNSQISAIISQFNFKTVHHGFQPEHTLLLDLTKSEEEILSQMKPKGRYNIKIAQKKGVQVIEPDLTDKKQTYDAVREFHKLLSETTERDNFSGHNLEFYRSMLAELAPHNLAKIYLAKYEDRVIAGIIVTFYKDTAIYYYGVSGNDYRNVMAPYLLQWTAIKEAENRGLHYYDFLGIAPENAKNHPWKGVTEFKKKFGGIEITYLPPQEYPFKKALYFLYSRYKNFKKRA